MNHHNNYSYSHNEERDVRICSEARRVLTALRSGGATSTSTSSRGIATNASASASASTSPSLVGNLMSLRQLLHRQHFHHRKINNNANQNPNSNPNPTAASSSSASSSVSFLQPFLDVLTNPAAGARMTLSSLTSIQALLKSKSQAIVFGNVNDGYGIHPSHFVSCILHTKFHDVPHEDDHGNIVGGEYGYGGYGGYGDDYGYGYGYGYEEYDDGGNSLNDQEHHEAVEWTIAQLLLHAVQVTKGKRQNLHPHLHPHSHNLEFKLELDPLLLQEAFQTIFFTGHSVHAHSPMHQCFVNVLEEYCTIVFQAMGRVQLELEMEKMEMEGGDGTNNGDENSDEDKRKKRQLQFQNDTDARSCIQIMKFLMAQLHVLPPTSIHDDDDNDDRMDNMDMDKNVGNENESKTETEEKELEHGNDGGPVPSSDNPSSSSTSLTSSPPPPPPTPTTASPPVVPPHSHSHPQQAPPPPPHPQPQNFHPHQYDQMRITSLKLLRTCLRIAYEPLPGPGSATETNNTRTHTRTRMEYVSSTHQTIIANMIQNDLCLALLLMGQHILTPPHEMHTHTHAHTHVHTPATMTLLMEVCHTISFVWKELVLLLPKHISSLSIPFQNVWSGIYTKSLREMQHVPLSCIPGAVLGGPSSHSITRSTSIAVSEYGSGVTLGGTGGSTGSTGVGNDRVVVDGRALKLYDDKLELVLESLVDIVCFHGGIGNGNGGTSGNEGSGNNSNSNSTFETLFELYDCHIQRMDVAGDLVRELCHCCGGDGRDMNMNGDGEEDSSKHPNADTGTDATSVSSAASGTGAGTGTGTPARSRSNSTRSQSWTSSSDYGGGGGMEDDNGGGGGTMQQQQQQPRPRLPQYRNVPPHLRELCAEALMGIMNSLFVTPSSSSSSTNTADGNEQSSASGANSKSISASASAYVAKLQQSKQQKKQWRMGARLFSQKSTSGINHLVHQSLLPTPTTPTSIAKFLRHGLVLGLSKPSIGEYLGTIGKSPVPNQSPPDWERDWFHADVLKEYCHSFHFEKESLIDCLRMFLASFRLPGEAQQIDRILQAFAESCVRSCRENEPDVRYGNGRRIFSPDVKKASDAAYLLSFSIIMLNTDLHNDNIRPDRKMTMEAFVRNNTDYGRDITDEGYAFPQDYLEGIYRSIQYEQIRTVGEGAEGIMTVERWKDVLKAARRVCDEEEEDYGMSQSKPNCDTAASAAAVAASAWSHGDMKHFISEHLWMPILSAIEGLWNAPPTPTPTQSNRGGMIGIQSQGARLGIDLSMTMLKGVRNLSRLDIFQDLFVRICFCTGLLGEYTMDAVERTAAFVDSVERQGALLVALRTAMECGDWIGLEGWKCVWSILLEMRDLKLLGGGKSGWRHSTSRRSILLESDMDLLRPDTRRDWEMRLVKECYDATGGRSGDNRGGRNGEGKGLMSRGGFFGTLIFGSPTTASSATPRQEQKSGSDSCLIPSEHGKEELVLWDDLAPSDTEDDDDDEASSSSFDHAQAAAMDSPSLHISLGYEFEKLLIQESQSSIMNSHQGPITGLETYEDTRSYHVSPRAKVRRRLSHICDFSMIISETRFLDMDGLKILLRALADVIGGTTTVRDRGCTDIPVVISPGSEAVAEVWLCEITLKNRDRIGKLWNMILKDHYHSRLSAGLQPSSIAAAAVPPSSSSPPQPTTPPPSNEPVIVRIPGMEKCMTGLLRICFHSVHRKDVNNEVLQSLQLLCNEGCSVSGAQHGHGHGSPSSSSGANNKTELKFDKHISEGLWRICRDVDGLRLINNTGWDGLLSVIQFCASRGDRLIIREGEKTGTLLDDDPALQAFRCLHLVLRSNELRDVVPFRIVHCIRALIAGGERNQCPKLSIAGLDLLSLLHARLQALIALSTEKNKEEDVLFWAKCWFSIVEGMADASNSQYPSTRQHSIAMFTDSLVDRHGQDVPIHELCRLLNGICVPMAGDRISELIQNQSKLQFDHEEIMIELELCISAIFKPFLHYLKRLTTSPDDFIQVWMSMLSVLSKLLGQEAKGGQGGAVQQQQSEYGRSRHHHPHHRMQVAPHHLLNTTKQHLTEHLRNAIMILMSKGIIVRDDESDDHKKTSPSSIQAADGRDISSLTWNAIENISYVKPYIQEWKQTGGGLVVEVEEEDGSTRKA